MNKKFHLAGIKKILLPRPKREGLLALSLLLVMTGCAHYPVNKP
jgi:hypothetical protein